MKSRLFKLISRLTAALILAGLIVGCGGTAKGAVLRSDKPRLAPDATGVEMAELVARNSAFAFDLYQALRTNEDNLFYSPYSISLALAMTYAGARGETERQMADTLHFTWSQDRLHRVFNALDQALHSRGQGEQAFRLHLINAIWGRRGYGFLPAFLDVLAENYGAGLRTLDFARQPDVSRQEINDWVSDETDKKIQDLLPPDAISFDTVLVLANAIYFNAAWKSPFHEMATGEDTFTRLDGSQVTVQMMRQLAGFSYVQGQGYQAVELPYEGDELSMVILLPDEGQFEAFALALDADRLKEILKGLQRETIHLSMPKFRYESGFQLKERLSTMGMPAAFAQADFSGINGVGGLWIDDVYHKAFISVDEKGTEAAAATAVVIEKAMAQQVRIDRPFIYVIRDIQSGTILFVGQVVDPSV
jgi:serpin B